MGEMDAKDPFKMVPMAGKILLEVDLKYSKLRDIHMNAGVYRLLLWAAASGKISDVVSGRGNIGFLMELPADPEWLMETEYPHSTFWKTELWKSFKSVSGVSTSSFNMGAYGHKAKRPTTVGSNYPAIVQMDGNHDFHDNCVPASLLTRSTVRAWSGTFKRVVVDSVVDLHEGTWAEEEDLAELGVKLTKLTKEQREEWRNHLINDRQPYRADCAVCINAQASGYQHRRRKHPHLYTAALAVAGPFATRGRDMECDDYKYMLVAAYRCPKDYMSMKALTEEERELYVPDEGDEPEGDLKDPFLLDEEEGQDPKEPVEPTTEEEANSLVPLLSMKRWNT